MQILQKLLAVALVSVVGSDDGVELSFAITLGAALTSGMVQPFLQPQAVARDVFLHRKSEGAPHFFFGTAEESPKANHVKVRE